MNIIKYTIKKTIEEERTAKFDNDNFISLLTYNSSGQKEYVGFIRYKFYAVDGYNKWTYKITVSDGIFKVERVSGTPERNAEIMLKNDDKNEIISNRRFLEWYEVALKENRELENRMFEAFQDIEDE